MKKTVEVPSIINLKKILNSNSPMNEGALYAIASSRERNVNFSQAVKDKLQSISTASIPRRKHRKIIDMECNVFDNLGRTRSMIGFATPQASRDSRLIGCFNDLNRVVNTNY